MKTPLDHFYDGCDEWGKKIYGKGYKIYRGDPTSILQKSVAYAFKYTLGKLNEKNATKKIAKANAKSKSKNGKQVKGLLKSKKKVSGRLS